MPIFIQSINQLRNESGKGAELKTYHFNLVGIILFLTTSGAYAVPIAVVGTIDTLISSTELENSSEATEENWIESVLGFDIFFTKLDDDASGGESGNWESVTGGNDGDYAFDFGVGVEPDYFLVKTGKNFTTDHTHFLFENFDSLQWAYINLGFSDEISHVGTASAAEVPEPTPHILLGIGLLMLSLMSGRGRIFQHQ